METSNNEVIIECCEIYLYFSDTWVNELGLYNIINLNYITMKIVFSVYKIRSTNQLLRWGLLIIAMTGIT